MPKVTLEPDQSVPLTKCRARNPLQETTITNRTTSEGAFVIVFDPPLATRIQYKLKPKHSITICSPASGKIKNDGEVPLSVTTPGD